MKLHLLLSVEISQWAWTTNHSLYDTFAFGLTPRLSRNVPRG